MSGKQTVGASVLPLYSGSEKTELTQENAYVLKTDFE